MPASRISQARAPGAANHTLLSPRCHLDDHEVVAQKGERFQESRFVESRYLHLLELTSTMCLGRVPSSVPAFVGGTKEIVLD